MPRRKRIDPTGSAPVDGDYRIDHLRGGDSDRVYVLLSDDDIPYHAYRGAAPEYRRPDGPKLAMDLGGNDGEQLAVRGLKLYSYSKERKAFLDAQPQQEADQRDVQLHKDTKHLDVSERQVKVGGGLPAMN